MGHPQVELQLFGTPEIRAAGGDPIDLPLGKPFALLVYLHLSDGPVSRDHLAGVFWASSDRERARGSLRHALWFLRKELGEDLFASDDPVALAPDRVTSDLATFRRHLAEDRLDEAKALWTGAPLQLLDLSDGVEWTHWVEALRLEIEDAFAAALAVKGHQEWEEGRPGEAVRWFEAAAEARPHRLRHHRDLVETLLDARDFAGAEEAIRSARRHLPDDDRAAEALAELDHRIALLSRGATSTDPEDPTLQLEFTGRDEAFAALLRRWRFAREGDPGIGLVTGEPGIGKTRLAREFAVVARAEGGRVVHLKAEDSERPIEWGLLSEAIQRLLKLSGASGISHASDRVLRTLVPSLNLADPASIESPDRSALQLPRNRPSAALSDALVDLITAVAEDAPLLLVIDDLHWADTESRAVLARIANRIQGVPLLLLFTSRREVESLRVRKTLTLLSESPRATTIALAPLSEEDIARVLRARITFSDAESEAGVIRRVHRTTRGNPLFLFELLKSFQEQGILEEGTEGRWHFRTDRLPPDFPLPESLRALVDRQLEQLSEEAQLVAAHLARIGHPASPRMLSLRTGLGTATVTNAIGELLQRRMVRWASPESLNFLHDELRAAVARRFQLHVGLTAGGGAQWSFFRTAVVASLALLMLGAAAYLFARPAATEPGLHGGGTLVLTQGSDITAFTLSRSEDDGSLEARPVTPPVSPPPSPGTRSIVRLISGETEWIPEDRLGLTPDGSHFLAHRVLPDGRHGLILEALDGEGEQVIWASRRRPEQVDISPRGQRVLFLLPGRPDALLVTTPGGRPLARETAPTILRGHWCGPDRVLLLSREEGRVTAHLWDPESDVRRPLRIEGLHLGGETACSPDGSAIILQGASAGRVGFYLHEPREGTLQPLDFGEGPAPDRIHWIPDSVPPIPSSIRITHSDPFELEWGEQTELDAELVFSDGTTLPDSLDWSSRDREVVFVGPSGEVTAVGPGESWVVAEWNGWLRDSLRVQVQSTGDGGTLIRERFADGGLEGWRKGPMARSPWEVLTEEGIVRLSGSEDDSGHFLLSERALALTEGGTVELEFRLPLSADSHQSIALCLVQWPGGGGGEEDSVRRDPPAAARGGASATGSMDEIRRSAEQSGCIRYPAGIGEQWDPRRIEIHSHRSFPGTPIDVTGTLPHEGWVHLALSLGPDGSVTAYVDREWAGVAPVYLDDTPGPWRIAIVGEARDTSLEVRRLSLWPQVRYRTNTDRLRP